MSPGEVVLICLGTLGACVLIYVIFDYVTRLPFDHK